MASTTYSTNLKIELQGTGENPGTWGTITNTNLGTTLEQAIVGYGNPSYASDANLTLTYTDTNAAQTARALVLNVTSAVSLTATRELVVPTIQKQYIVQNNTTGAQSITVKTSAGTGITVPNGRKAHLYVDGTNVIQMSDFVDINGGTIDGTPIGASSASTGAFTTLTASSTATLSGLTASTALALDASKNVVSVANTGSGSNVLATSPTLTTPNLGTPSAIVLTNASGTASININGTVGATTPTTGAFTTLSASGTATLSGLTASTALALDASKNIASVTNTGTGNNVLATSPTLTTPNLGTPSSLTLTNATGLPIDGGTINTLPVTRGGSGATTLTGVLKGNGTSAFTAGNVNLASEVTGTLPVTSGGTGLTGGTSGGLPYFNAASTLASSGVLTANALVIGGGAGAAPSTTTTGTGILTFLGTPSSANLAAAVTGETGSGALVFGTSPSLTTPALSGETFSTNAAVTAGTNVQGQGALTSDYNIVTTAANNPSGVTLPTATTGRRIIIVNKGANPINVFPATGGAIDALGANTPISIVVGGYMELNASSTTQWYSTANIIVSSTGAVTSFSAGATGLTPSSATAGAITLGGTLSVANGGTGITSFGTGVATALGVNTDSSGSFVVNGGALGTPSSGTVTNLTGTASININGTVGATTPNTGAFTSVVSTSASGVLSRAAATQDGVALVGRAGGTSSHTVSLTPATLSASRTVTLPDSNTTLPIATQQLTFSGPTASRTYTLPDASTTLLSTNAAVTVPQGGTGLTGGTSGGLPYFNAANTMASSGVLAANALVIGGGAGAAPSTTTTGTGILTFLGTPSSSNLAAAVTDETGSGALVFGTSPSLTTPALSGETFSTNAAVTAGTNAQGQGALTSDYNVITTAASNPSGVTLPTATTGRRIIIVNKGANPINVFPATGGAIDALGANIPISVVVGGYMEFNASSTTQWYSTANIIVSSSGSVSSFSGGLTGLTPSSATTGAITLGGTLAVANGGTGITSFGTGVATALGVNTGSSGSFVVNGGALGTPSSGTVTNLTGTASININGTVGATTANSGAFTSLSASGTTTLSGLTASTALALDASKNVVSVTNTGSGNNVLATSPVLTTPNLGTPSALTLTNATGLPIVGGTTGTLSVSRGGTGQDSYTDGQLLIGNTTGNTLTKSTLTAGSGISITNGNGAITIATTGGNGTVTSVGQTFTGGLISVSGSPVTSTGTLALTVAGTSGGIPYFSSASSWASSAALAANSLVIGGGAGAAPATTTTGSGVLTALGNSVNTTGGVVTQSGALASNALLLGGGSGTAISSATTGTGVVTALGNSVNAANGVATTNGTATLTNKRIDPRVVSASSAASLTPDVSAADIYAYTALAEGLTINAPTGTPVDGSKLVFRILDNGTSRALTWNGTYVQIGVTLPTATTANKTTYVGCIYNAYNARWDVLAVSTQA
jgi:hypothetical protein